MQETKDYLQVVVMISDRDRLVQCQAGQCNNLFWCASILIVARPNDCVPGSAHDLAMAAHLALSHDAFQALEVSWFHAAVFLMLFKCQLCLERGVKSVRMLEHGLEHKCSIGPHNHQVYKQARAASPHKNCRARLEQMSNAKGSTVKIVDAAAVAAARQQPR
jgi:hypothetical protein